MAMSEDVLYPSLKSIMRIELFTSNATREASVVMDRPFREPLVRVELDLARKRLYFVFKNSVWDLGNELHELVISVLTEIDKLGFAQIDLETGLPQSVFQVPLLPAAH